MCLYLKLIVTNTERVIQPACLQNLQNFRFLAFDIHIIHIRLQSKIQTAAFEMCPPACWQSQCMWMNSRSVTVDDRTQNSASHPEKSSGGDLTWLDRNSISFSTLSYKARRVQHSGRGWCVYLWLMEQKVWGLPKVLKGSTISHIPAVLRLCFKCWNYDFINRLVD